MKKSNKKSILKFSAAGNDFLIVDERGKKNKTPLAKRKRVARSACDRHEGIGADGLLFLDTTKNKKNAFKWDFYNQDGSRPKMCLNAARCAGLYEHERTKNKIIFFETKIGTIKSKKISFDQVEVRLPRKLSKRGKIISLKTLEKKVRGYFVDSGVPHFVLQKNNFDTTKDICFAKKIREYKKFKPHGANVTLWCADVTKKNILAATFERGVEDFTRSCGTGAAALAIMFFELARQNKTTVKMPGGKISVEILEKENALLVRGPAKRISYEIY